jgi:hypothetical protein
MDLRCPYCGDLLTVTQEWKGFGYNEERVVDAIECNATVNSHCGAEWDPEGTLRHRPDWQECPDLYSKPDDARREVDADDLARLIGEHTGCAEPDEVADELLSRYHVTRREVGDE